MGVVPCRVPLGPRKNDIDFVQKKVKYKRSAVRNALTGRSCTYPQIVPLDEQPNRSFKAFDLEAPQLKRRTVKDIPAALGNLFGGTIDHAVLVLQLLATFGDKFCVAFNNREQRDDD
ncbi:hypothetical protein J6590_009152 [Homalodisca vitripennis]|nr:hypothetical protein J6590_009152 [Homalodisca vitripennis]